MNRPSKEVILRSKLKALSSLTTCFKSLRNSFGNIYRALTPPPIAILEGLIGVAVNKILCVAVELRIAEHLNSGGKTYEEIASLAQSQPQRILRIMRALIGLGFFKIDNKKRYYNNRNSKFLLEEHPQSLREFVLMFSSPWLFSLFEHSTQSVVTGKSAIKLSGGDSFFDSLHAIGMGDRFDRAMESFCRTSANFVASSFDFSPFKKVCDLGGGTGTTVMKILKRNPHLKGIVYDLPHVAEKAEDNFTKNHLEDRAQAIGGNFFETVPNDCDLFILQATLHDWSDKEVKQILSRVRQNAPSAQILVIESLRSDHDRYDFAKLVDVWMLLAIGDGMERSFKEFEEIFRDAGYSIRENFLLPNLFRVMRITPSNLPANNFRRDNDK